MKSTNNPRENELLRCLGDAFRRLESWLEAFTAGRWWLVSATLLATVISLVLAFPSLEKLPYLGEFKRVPVVEAQIEDLGAAWREYPTDNAAFRLTVPLVVSVVGGGYHVALAVQALCGVMLLFLSARIGWLITGDRVTALLLAIAVGTSYAGSAGFIELRGMFDSVAFALLLLAMAVRSPWVIAPATLLACFTDERAVLASSLVIVWWAIDREDRSWQIGLGSFFNLRTAAVLAGVGAYLAGRVWIALRFQVETEALAEVHFYLFAMMNNLPLALWTALEGLWIVVLVGVAALVVRRCWAPAVLVVVPTLTILVAGGSQIDLTRGMAYVLPTVVVALRIVHDELGESSRSVVALGGLLSVLWPCYYVGGAHSIWWHYPLPLQLVRWILM